MIPFLNLSGLNNLHRSELESAFLRTFQSGHYILGKELELFEQEFAGYCKAAYCIGTDNGTNALSLCLKALNASPGKEVILASNSYVSAFLAVINNGLSPVLAEPDYKTCNIHPAAIESCISENTVAILITHMYGRVCDMESIANIAASLNLVLLDDCSHAHGARYQGKTAGNLATLSAFSFYPTKNLGALGDGGAITTSNERLANRLRLLRNYGYGSKNHLTLQGANSRLDEIQAAFLRVKLKYLDQENDRRRAIASRYLEEIHNPNLTLPEPDKESSWHLFVLRTDKRDNLMDYLKVHGIEPAIHYPVPPHHQEAFAHLNQLNLPVAERLHREVVSIPLHPLLSPQEVTHIINTLNRFE